MGEQGAFGYGPKPWVHIVIGQRQPLVWIARRVGLHHRSNFCLAHEPVGFEVADCAQSVGHGVSVGWKNKLHLVREAAGVQNIQGVQVICHVAVRRVNDGGASVQNVVARKQNAVLAQQQADVVGGMAWRVNHLQRMAFCTSVCGAGVQRQGFPVVKSAIRNKLAVGPRRGRRGHSPDGRRISACLNAQRLQGQSARRVVCMRMGANNSDDVAARAIRVCAGLPKPLDVVGIGGTGVDHDVAGERFAHHIAVGSRARHETGVGSGQAQYVFQKRHGFLRLPVGGCGQRA